MREQPIWNSLRPPTSAWPYHPPRSDYPVPLLTRRTYAFMAGGVLAQRQYAPQSIAVAVPRSPRGEIPR